jgi:hypothetical protein
MLRTVIAMSLVTCACGKEAPTAAPAPPPTPSASAAPVVDAAPAPSAPAAAPSAAAATPPPTCPAGFTANAVPAYCIKLPPSYTLKASQTSAALGSITYNTGSPTDALNVSYDDSPMATILKNVEGELKFGSGKIEKKGDLPGGSKWFQGKRDDYSRLVTVIKGAKYTLKCSFTYKPKAPPPQDAIGACKSMVIPP